MKKETYEYRILKQCISIKLDMGDVERQLFFPQRRKVEYHPIFEMRIPTSWEGFRDRDNKIIVFFDEKSVDDFIISYKVQEMDYTLLNQEIINYNVEDNE